MSSIEFDAAVLELEALGELELHADGELMCLTDKGTEHARGIINRLPMDERLLVTLVGGQFAEYCEHKK